MTDLDARLTALLASAPPTEPSAHLLDHILVRRSQLIRRRRFLVGGAGIAALGLILAVATPLVIARTNQPYANTHHPTVVGSSTAAPPEVVDATQEFVASFDGAQVTEPVLWVKTTSGQLSSWKAANDLPVGSGEPGPDVYVIEVHGNFQCDLCGHGPPAMPGQLPANTSFSVALIDVPVTAGSTPGEGHQLLSTPLDLSQLGDVESFTLGPQG